MTGLKDLRLIPLFSVLKVWLSLAAWGIASFAGAALQAEPAIMTYAFELFLLFLFVASLRLRK